MKLVWVAKKEHFSFSIVQTLIHNLKNMKKAFIQLKIKKVLEPIRMSHYLQNWGIKNDYQSLPTLTCSLDILLFKEKV